MLSNLTAEQKQLLKNAVIVFVVTVLAVFGIDVANVGADVVPGV